MKVEKIRDHFVYCNQILVVLLEYWGVLSSLLIIAWSTTGFYKWYLFSRNAYWHSEHQITSLKGNSGTVSKYANLKVRFNFSTPIKTLFCKICFIKQPSALRLAIIFLNKTCDQVNVYLDIYLSSYVEIVKVQFFLMRK